MQRRPRRVRHLSLDHGPRRGRQRGAQGGVRVLPELFVHAREASRRKLQGPAHLEAMRSSALRVSVGMSGGSGERNGSLTVNLLPFPGELWTSILPPGWERGAVPRDG